MARIHDKAAEELQPTGGGVRRMVADGSESIAELREFMASIRGKSPQEVLGAAASSSLIKSTIIAGLGFAVVIVGISIVSYGLSSPSNQKVANQKGSRQPVAAGQIVGQSKDDGGTDQGDPGATKSGTSTSSDVTGRGKDADASDTVKSGDPKLDNLGIGESKKADPQKNPLEDSLDALFEKDK